MEDYWQNGVLLYVDGFISTPEEIMMQHCVQEERMYMADFILNDQGKLVELRYDRITKL